MNGSSCLPTNRYSVYVHETTRTFIVFLSQVCCHSHKRIPTCTHIKIVSDANNARSACNLQSKLIIVTLVISPTPLPCSILQTIKSSLFRRVFVFHCRSLEHFHCKEKSSHFITSERDKPLVDNL